MRISSIDTGFFKLDGGAMFGIVPKRLWQKLNPPDENNLCTWAMRCLLIETGDRKILVDTGLGTKYDEKFKHHFEPHGSATLLGSLKAKGLNPEEITDVFLTHLHFDHVGGATTFDAGGKVVPTFPNATYWSSEVHYKWAMEPKAREKASFLQENFVPIEQAGQLRFLPVQAEAYEWLPGIRIHFAYGHTQAMMLLEIQAGPETLIYCADLIPSSFHIGMPYIMSYDVQPLRTLVEKEDLLNQALDKNWKLILEHDPKLQGISLKKDDRNRIVIDSAYELA
ncbi:MAG: MBL fold metallo-hydrolase [Phaeodactylibacter sp.]|nr:MBL fold metallo-hydrolase [Phaeodactylibacter sp.]